VIRDSESDISPADIVLAAEGYDKIYAGLPAGAVERAFSTTMA
jgi:hypothetical protein